MTERMIILHQMRVTNRVACPKLRKAAGTTRQVSRDECAACVDNQGVGRLKVKCGYGECKKA